jgi:hypothetical protein
VRTRQTIACDAVVLPWLRVRCRPRWIRPPLDRRRLGEDGAALVEERWDKPPGTTHTTHLLKLRTGDLPNDIDQQVFEQHKPSAGFLWLIANSRYPEPLMWISSLVQGAGGCLGGLQMLWIGLGVFAPVVGVSAYRFRQARRKRAQQRARRDRRDAAMRKSMGLDW